MKLRKSCFLLLVLAKLLSICYGQSLFDSIETPDKKSETVGDSADQSGLVVQPILQPQGLNDQNSSTVDSNDPGLSNLNALIEKMKDKVSNPLLKNNLNLESISNFLANFLSGNEFVNNLEVKKASHLSKVDISDKLKVQGEADVNSLNVKESFRSKVFNITDDRITFNPEATIKMSNSRLVFRVKDIFEVITFMKYIVKICGSKLEKCDFGHLLKNSQNEQMQKVMKLLEDKQAHDKKIQEVTLNSTLNVNQPTKGNLRKNDNSKTGAELNSKSNNYSFKETNGRNGDLFENNEEIERELNLQLKLYKEKQRDKLMTSYEQFIQNPISEEQTLNDYYYNFNTNSLY